MANAIWAFWKKKRFLPWSNLTFPLSLQKQNCTAVSQSESINFVMYTIRRLNENLADKGQINNMCHLHGCAIL